MAAKSGPFSDAAAYDAELGAGLSWTGEDKGYFIAGRLRALTTLLGKTGRSPPRTIVDFGCGIGDGALALTRVFPGATVTGVEPEVAALATSRQRFRDAPRLDFAPDLEAVAPGSIDLCFVNGVFHHIPVTERAAVMGEVARALAPGGTLAFFENNPLNPGTQWVMHRIPFDRNAVKIPHWEAERLVRAAGLAMLAAPRFLFFFPRMLSALRGLERRLTRIPLGGQYLVLAGK